MKFASLYLTIACLALTCAGVSAAEKPTKSNPTATAGPIPQQPTQSGLKLKTDQPLGQLFMLSLKGGGVLLLDHQPTSLDDLHLQISEGVWDIQPGAREIGTVCLTRVHEKFGNMCAALKADAGSAQYPKTATLKVLQTGLVINIDGDETLLAGIDMLQPQFAKKTASASTPGTSPKS